MVTLEEILNIAKVNLGAKYVVKVKEVAYKHSTMGRKDDKTRDVNEYLIIAKQL
jgi:adenine-specific DNA-methyltransferase